MADFYLLNTTNIGSTIIPGGSVVRDTTDPISLIQLAGGILVDVQEARDTLVAAAERAQQARARGASYQALDAIMLTAFSSGLSVAGLPEISAPTFNVHPDGRPGASGTADDPVNTISEVGRRLSGRRLRGIGFMNLLGDIEDHAVLKVDQDATYFTALIVTGTPTVLGTGTLTAIQNFNTTTRLECKVTAAGLPVSWTASGFVGFMLRLTSGVAEGASAWVESDLGSKVARTGPFMDPNSGLYVEPVGNETFEVLRMPQVSGSFYGESQQLLLNFLWITNDGDTFVDPFTVANSGDTFTSWCRIDGGGDGHAIADAGCVWVPFNNYFNDVHVRALNAGSVRMSGCMGTGATAPTADGRGSSVFIDQPSVGYGEGTLLQAREGGKWVISPGSWWGSFDQIVGAVIGNGAEGACFGPLFGRGITSIGLQVSSGGTDYIDAAANVPNLVNSNTGPTFPTKQVSLGGSSVTYATVSTNITGGTLTKNANNEARILPLVS